MGEAVADQPERRLIAAGPSEEGWTIIQVWDSREPLERFIEDHLRPAMERAGERGYRQPPKITDIESSTCTCRRTAQPDDVAQQSPA
jgi:hypothetical protein